LLENFYSYKIDGMTANPLKFYGFLNFGPQRFTENRLCGKLTDHMEISSGGTAVTIFNRLLAAVKYIVKKADMVLLGLCLVCTAFGIVLIASATQYTVKLSRCVPVQAAAAFIGVSAITAMTTLPALWQTLIAGGAFLTVYASGVILTGALDVKAALAHARARRVIKSGGGMPDVPPDN